MRKTPVPATALKAVLSCLILSLFSSSLIFAQSNYLPAVVVNNQGDSLPGKIDFRNWKKNPESINFVNDANENRIFDVLSIKSFYIKGEGIRYISSDVTLDNTPDNYVQAVSNRTTKPSAIKKKIFLLQIVKSESLSLYTYADNNRVHYFFTNGDAAATELIYHFLFVENTGEVEAVTSYKQQLFSLLSGCTKVANRIDGVHYSEKEIKQLFLNYLKCNNDNTLAETKKEEHLPITFGVVAGAMYNSFKFVGNGHITPDKYSDISTDKFSSNLSPLFGVSLDIGLQRISHKWHVVNELIYKRYATSSSSFTHTVLYDYTNDIDLEFSYIQLNTLLRFVAPTRSFVQPFINIGLGNGLRITANKNSSHLTYNNRPSESSVAIDGPEKHESSLLGGLGLTHKKIQVEGRFAYGNGFSPYVRLKSKVSSPQFILTYQF